MAALGGQIFRLNQSKYFILNTKEIVTVSLKYRFWVRAWPKRESLYFTLTLFHHYRLTGLVGCARKTRTPVNIPAGFPDTRFPRATYQPLPGIVYFSTIT